VLVAWVVRRLRDQQAYVNERSYIRAGTWWIVSLAVITPVLLIVVTAFNLYEELAVAYGDYPVSGLLVFGWGVTIAVIVAAFVMQRVRSREAPPEDAESIGTSGASQGSVQATEREDT
jgi:NSS family neurotransmitter:Na+ symporter